MQFKFGKSCQGYYQYRGNCWCIPAAFLSVVEPQEPRWMEAKMIIESRFNEAIRIVKSAKFSCGCCMCDDYDQAVNMLNQLWVPEINDLLKPLGYRTDAYLDIVRTRNNTQYIIIIRIFDISDKQQL
jgi:hypothetical protein